MKINYQETSSDLTKRINIHDQYGSRNIDDWMISLLNLKQGMKVLDVACGSGKQCISYYQNLNGVAEITGGDVSSELLQQARMICEEKNYAINFTDLNFNLAFQFPDNYFDLLSCCFAIYYSENILFTVREMHRILKPEGVFFATGPMPENKKFFYDVIKEATDKPIPRMPGSSRFSTEIFDTIKKQFTETTLYTFENPLTFFNVEPFIEYTRASLSEDRKLWGDLFQKKDDFENIMAQIESVAKKYLARDGKLIMTKVVGGILAKK